MNTNINQYDANVITNSLTNFNTNNGLTSTGDYANSSNIITNSIETVYGTSDVNDAVQRTILMTTLVNFMNDTANYVIFNDLSNNNAYVAETLKTETERMTNIKNKTFNNTYKKQSQFFQKKYVISYNNFIKNIIKYLILLCIVITLIMSFYLKQKIPKFIVYIALSVLSVLSFVIILIYVKNVQTRRKDDWSKYYFSGMAKDNTSKSCTAPIVTSEKN
jgi:hypothetical protein